MKTVFSSVVVVVVVVAVASVSVASAAAINTASGGSASQLLRTDASAPPHPVGRLGWYGVVVEGGPEVYYEGDDLDDVDAQIGMDHPGLSLFDGSMKFATNTNTTAEGVPQGPGIASIAAQGVVRLEETGLEARDVFNNICDLQGRWGILSAWGLQDNENHLRSVSRCLVQPRQCIRVGCTRDAGTVFCNDNDFIYDMACSHLADMSRNLRDACNPGNAVNTMITAGQRFNQDKRYNVIHADCKYFSARGQPV